MREISTDACNGSNQRLTGVYNFCFACAWSLGYYEVEQNNVFLRYFDAELDGKFDS